jgi:hypothetical protein
MKISWVFLATVFFTLLSPVRASETAQATLFCRSFRFQQGSDSFDSTMDLSTTTNSPNGELAPWYMIYTHRSKFRLNWMDIIEITGDFYLDVPNIPDANGNGFNDSFEVSQAVSGTSSGEYDTVLGGGTISATWTRGAGSKFGTCSLHMVDDTYGDLGTFQHTFEVMEYKGPLIFTPGTNTVSGDLNLTNDVGEIQSTLSFTKSSADPYNELTLAGGNWTNAALQTFVCGSSDFYRDLNLETNYYGFVVYDDGDLNTGAADYRVWTLSIDDLNDSDDDAIPDFSDDPSGIAPPRRPLLTLSLGQSNLLLTISGDVGHVHDILESTTLTPGSWTTNVSVTLTNDPQTVLLPLPDVPQKFWRAVAE